jgi:hypothetical protein
MCAQQAGRPQTQRNREHDQELRPANGSALGRIGRDRDPIALIEPDVGGVPGCRNRDRELLGPARQFRVEPIDGTRGGEIHGALVVCLRFQANAPGLRRAVSWLPITHPFAWPAFDDRTQT